MWMVMAALRTIMMKLFRWWWMKCIRSVYLALCFSVSIWCVCMCMSGALDKIKSVVLLPVWSRNAVDVCVSINAYATKYNLVNCFFNRLYGNNTIRLVSKFYVMEFHFSLFFPAPFIISAFTSRFELVAHVLVYVTVANRKQQYAQLLHQTFILFCLSSFGLSSSWNEHKIKTEHFAHLMLALSLVFSLPFIKIKCLCWCTKVHGFGKIC